MASSRTGPHWLESLLERRGYTVLRAHAGQPVLGWVGETQPDLWALDADLSDGGVLETCRGLRHDPAIGNATPIVVTGSESLGRQVRLALLGAGAWECVDSSSDIQELVLRLDSFVRARQELDLARLYSLTDAGTGLYNRQGLARRARELGAQAFREHHALACVVLALDVGAGLGAADVAVAGWVQLLKEAGRLSDVIGWLGRNELAVLAPATDAAGAVKLAERLTRELHGAPPQPGGEVPTVQVRVGYHAVANLRYSPIQPLDLVVQAATALRTGAPERGLEWIRRFENPMGGGSA